MKEDTPLMARSRRRVAASWGCALVALSLAACSSPENAADPAADTEATAEAAPGTFTSMFDGTTLNGWRGDPAVWSVRDGAITASTTEPISHNTFLIHETPYRDFEIRFKYRVMTPTGNSGLQFRSAEGEGSYVLGGYQANVTAANFSDCGLPSCGQERFGMLYEELNRTELVLLGEKAVITRAQATTGGTGSVVRTVTGTTNPREDILAAIKPAPEWNEVVVIAYDNRIIHAINNYVAFDATDNDGMRMREGLIGIQAHAGPPATMQFKDFEIMPLTSLPADLDTRFITKPGPAPEPVRVPRTVRMEKVEAQ